MKNILLAGLTAFIALSCAGDNTPKTLKQAFQDKFLIGVAVNDRQAGGIDSVGAALIAEQFSSIVNEDCLKSENVHPQEGTYVFDAPDAYVDFGVRNHQFVVGHTLIWHSQLAPWFCVDEAGNDVTPEVLKARMKDHISTLVGRYKGKINGWDVVNEAINEDGTWRDTPFYRILGEEYIPLAFQYAHEADPDAELYYNEYNLFVPAKCEKAIELVKMLRERGLRIDAVGNQGHMGMEYPDINALEKSIERLSEAGVKVMITETEMSALPSPFGGAEISDRAAYEERMNPYPDGLPEEVAEAWNERVKSFMELYLRHADVITRVTFWGLSDGDSWRNDWPIPGRTDYPLLYDRNHAPKPVTQWMMNL